MSYVALEKAIQTKQAKIGVIGLGYVGLPLIRAFVAAGFQTMGFDVDPTKVDRLLAGESYIEHIPSELDRRVRPRGQVRAHGRHAPAGRGRRPADLRAHAAEREPRSGPDLRRGDRPADRRRRCGPASSSCWRARPIPARRATWCCRSSPTAGLKVGQGLLPGLQPRARRPGQPRLSRPSGIPKVVGGIDPASARLAALLYRQAVVQRRAGLELRGGRGLQDPREHLPRGEHRHGQRAEDALRPDGHRRLGGDRRGQDQAVRLPGVLSRARAWAGTASRSTRSI